MRKFFLLLVFHATFLLTATIGYAQDFSNKGKEFWLAYCYHVSMINNGGNPSNYPVMTLYLTSDVNTAYTVEIYGVTTLQTGNITAGQVITVTIPSAYWIDNEGMFNNKAIHVTSDKPIAMYAYITRSAISGATICLPVNVLGREYFSMNFTQASNENNSNSYFTVIGVLDSTTVEITPSANTKNGWIANNTYSISLNKGQIYQVLGTTNGLNGVDLTGSKIKSVGGTSGCKRIAVFSGSGKIRIPSSGCSQNTSDNLFQQLYPMASWGKKYLTVPSYSRVFNYYRVARSDTTANVFVNGTLIPSSSFTNNWYQFSGSSPNLVESDKPICVGQYFTTQGCDGNPSPYDPDMIMLNPVEQNINNVTLISSNLYASPPQHHLHVIMRNAGTGISTFTFDGAPVPSSSWTTHPYESNYSYLYLPNVTQGYHTLASDSGFNAIAYGYAPAESYGYSAGSNVKDLYQFISIQNEFGTVSFPAACKNSPFYFAIIFPYQPTQIIWDFGGLFPNVTINNPVYDSTWIVNGRQLYRYKLPTSYTVTSTGTFPIKVYAQNPTPDGCSGLQEIDFDLQVFDPPSADFTFTNSGCVTDTVFFFDNSNLNGRNAIRWHWDFGDSGIDSIRNTQHKYALPGTYSVRYSLITDIGCISDTAIKTVSVSAVPLARFGASIPDCVNKSITFTDSSLNNGSTLVRWYWNFGDGSPQVIATSNSSQTHTYTSTGIFNVTLKVETSTGCQSVLFTLPVTIHPNPVANFSLPNVCMPVGAAQFNDLSTISGGESIATWSWDFGDGGTSTVQNPLHNYSGLGPYNVKLAVTSVNGCTHDTTKVLSSIYAEPQAAFTAPPEICLDDTAHFTDQSTAPNSTVTRWLWDFGDGATDTIQNPSHRYAAAGTYTVTLTVTSAIGCQTITASHKATRTIVVNPLPTANFNTSVPACETRDITFTDASLANAGALTQWTWDFGDGNNSVLNSGIPFIHVYANAGTYTVTLQVETNKGCKSSLLTKQIVINPTPLAGFISPKVCLTDPIAPFIDTSKVASGNIVAWNWNFGDPNATPGNPNTSTLQNPGHRYTTVGTYTATLIVTTNNGCKDTIAQTFTVNGSIPIAGFNVQNANVLCSNQTVTVTDASTVDFGSIVKVEVYWDFANDPTNKIIDTDPAPGKNYSHVYPEFGNPFTKTYTVQYVAYSGINCVNTISKTITVLATPTLQFDTVAPVCANDPSFQITEVQLLNGLPGTFVFSGTGVSAAGSFDPALAGPGLHAIRYTYTGTNGCSNYKEQTIRVYPVPTVDAGPDRFMLDGGQTTLLGSGSGNNISYLWTPNVSLDSNTISQPIATPSNDITYTLTVTSSDGCKANDEVFVKVLKAPVIPNIFSPNGDGVHDKWEIQYLNSYPGCTVDIYNRYGQLIFHSIGYDDPWDGTIKGKPVPVGTYYYIVDPKNGRKKVAGYVDVIR